MAYVKLIELVRKFDSGVIELPLMQRDYVWPAAKVVDLLDSLYKKWPIGVFYIWKTPNLQAKREAAICRQVGAKIAEPFWATCSTGNSDSRACPGPRTTSSETTSPTARSSTSANADL